ECPHPPVRSPRLARNVAFVLRRGQASNDEGGLTARRREARVASSRSHADPSFAGELMSVETVGLDYLRAHVRVTGELDMSTGAPLWAVLQSHLAAGRRFLRLDLSAVGFLDAAALSGIV